MEEALRGRSSSELQQHQDGNDRDHQNHHGLRGEDAPGLIGRGATDSIFDDFIAVWALIGLVPNLSPAVGAESRLASKTIEGVIGDTPLAS